MIAFYAVVAARGLLLSSSSEAKYRSANHYSTNDEGSGFIRSYKIYQPASQPVNIRDVKMK